MKAIWAIGNITGGCETSRSYILEKTDYLSYLEVILTNLKDLKKSSLRTLVWTISNMVRGKARPPIRIVSFHI